MLRAGIVIVLFLVSTGAATGQQWSDQWSEGPVTLALSNESPNFVEFRIRPSDGSGQWFSARLKPGEKTAWTLNASDPYDVRIWHYRGKGQWFVDCQDRVQLKGCCLGAVQDYNLRVRRWQTNPRGGYEDLGNATIGFSSDGNGLIWDIGPIADKAVHGTMPGHRPPWPPGGRKK